jgi:hypothetical protein
VDPARTKIQVTLTQLRGVGNNRANAKSTPDKTVERIRRSAFIVCNLLDPAFDKPDAEAVLNRLMITPASMSVVFMFLSSSTS